MVYVYAGLDRQSRIELLSIDQSVTVLIRNALDMKTLSDLLSPILVQLLSKWSTDDMTDRDCCPGLTPCSSICCKDRYS